MKTIKLKPAKTLSALDYAWQKAKKLGDEVYKKWMRENIRKFLRGLNI